MNNIDDFNADIIQINGPLNVARLEGSINGINKVIYLFMDMHIEVERQTECTNIFGRDVQNYLVENFMALNDGPVVYDFFFEISASGTQIQTPDSYKYKDKYIMEINKIFKRVFKYDRKENRVKISDVFRNVRLHYLDIRDYFEIEVYDHLGIADYESKRFYRTGFTPEGFENIIESITTARQQLQFVIDTLNKSNDVVKDRTNLIKYRRSWAADKRAVQQLAYKIKYRYNYPKIQEILTRQLDDIVRQIVEYINNMDKIIINLEKYYDEILTTDENMTSDPRTTIVYNYGLSDYAQREILYNISNDIDYLMDYFLDLFAKLVDIYFLRRFLDKDYITNAIVYSGMAHSVNYIHILVNYFGFRVTHTARSKLELDELMAAIKKYPMTELMPILSPEKPYQCSDITHFPENFL